MLLIWLETVTRWNITFSFLDDADTKKKKMNDANIKKLKGTLKKIQCGPRDHMFTQPKIKIEIWSPKVKIDLIGVWHNENMPHGTNIIGMK